MQSDRRRGESFSYCHLPAEPPQTGPEMAHSFIPSFILLDGVAAVHQPRGDHIVRDSGPRLQVYICTERTEVPRSEAAVGLGGSLQAHELPPTQKNCTPLPGCPLFIRLPDICQSLGPQGWPSPRAPCQAEPGTVLPGEPRKPTVCEDEALGRRNRPGKRGSAPLVGRAGKGQDGQLGPREWAVSPHQLHTRLALAAKLLLRAGCRDVFRGLSQKICSMDSLFTPV